MLSAIHAVIATLKGVFKTDKYLSEQQLMSKYDKLCVIVDEVIHEVRMPWYVAKAEQPMLELEQQYISFL